MVVSAIIIAAACLCMPARAGTATAKPDNDTTATALYKELRAKFNTDDQQDFYATAQRYRSHCLRSGRMHEYYNGWQAEIMYDINFNHFYRAMKKTLKMSKDMKERRCTDELYNATYLIGVIYSLQGNTELAKTHFLRAIDEAGKQDPLRTIHIYKDLANVEMDSNPSESMTIIDHAIDITRKAGQRYEYSDLVSFKVIVAFAMRDWDMVRQCHDLYMKMQHDNAANFSTTYYTYAQICRHTADRQWAEAIACADRLTNIDKYKFKADVYEISGDMSAAYAAQREYMHIKDSVNSTIMVQELGNATTEIESVFTRIRAEEAKVMRIALVLTIFMALVIIAALVFIIKNRNRYLRELWQKNNELEVLRDKAEEAERMKESILKNMSHEVRTPLNIIAGFSQILGQSDFSLTPEEREDIAARMTESSNDIVRIINDLLYLSSRDSINYAIRNDIVDCNALCRSCMDKFSGAVADGVAMTFGSTLPDGTTIRTNSEGMQRILECLLDNACKFTERGSIATECRKSDGGDAIEISVTDTGCGIAESERGKIFDLFYKTDTDAEGLGIGLVLAQRIARQLGGSICLDMNHTSGTRFVITMPAE